MGESVKVQNYGKTMTYDNSSFYWNFEKFLIGKDGAVARRFSPTIKPEDPILVEAIEAELAK